MKKFFVSCNLGFEEELEKELAEFWPFLLALDGKTHAEPLNLIERDRGGLVIENSLHLGLQINYFSKLANRVLLRVSEFRVRDFPKLFSKLRDLKKDSLLQGFPAGFRFEVAASQSRLNNEKRILEILREVLPEDKLDTAQALFVRMNDDLCSISLDSSGEHLHKRSERWKAGEAPLRETLAAFCARKLVEDLHFTDLADVTLVDPMAGTGTLLLEASLLLKPTPRQDFPFLQWKTTPKILKNLKPDNSYVPFPVLFGQVEAADVDVAVSALCEERLKAANLKYKLHHQDLFAAKPVSRRHFVLLNPPYGERLVANFSASELLSQLTRSYSPERIGVLFSENQARSILRDLKTSISLKEVAPLQLRSQSNFKNGGIAVTFLVFA